MDSRAIVKIKFSVYGCDFSQEFNINWAPESSGAYGVDHRVTDWFEKCYGEALEQFESQAADAMYRDMERKERREFERLKAKYDSARDLPTEGE